MKKKNLVRRAIVICLILVGGMILIQWMKISNEKEYIKGFQASAKKQIETYKTFDTQEERFNQLEKWRHGPLDYAYVLDENFNVLYHPNKELIGTSWTDVGISAFVGVKDQVLAGEKEVNFRYSYHDVEKFSILYQMEGDIYIVFSGEIR